MYAEERQLAIAQAVADRGRASVVDLAASLRVTTETIRRDLALLEGGGALRRVHGGAVAVGVLETLVGERDRIQVERKERIAAAAVALIPAGRTSLLLDAGTTTARLAAHLPTDRRLTVFTHGVPVAARIAGQPNVELHLLPGRVRPTTHAAVGAETLRALSVLQADVVFLGTNGLNERGATTPDAEEAAIKQALTGAARRRVVLTDSSKLGRDELVAFATLEEIDVVVTDSDATKEQLAPLRSAGLEVVIA